VLKTEKLWTIYYLDDLRCIYTFWTLFFYLSEGIGKSLHIDNINKGYIYLTLVLKMNKYKY
jgi:hypothetical protein